MNKVVFILVIVTASCLISYAQNESIKLDTAGIWHLKTEQSIDWKDSISYDSLAQINLRQSLRQIRESEKA